MLRSPAGATPGYALRMKPGGLVVPILLAATLAFAVPEGWHTSRKDGLAAATTSGKPLFLVTLWPPNV